MIDLEHPDPTRRLTFEQSMRLIHERYSWAIEWLRLGRCPCDCHCIVCIHDGCCKGWGVS